MTKHSNVGKSGAAKAQGPSKKYMTKPKRPMTAFKPDRPPQRLTARRAEQLNHALLVHSAKRNVSATARSADPVPNHPTRGFVLKNQLDKSYKMGTVRLHWKGFRHADGRTSGNTPFIGTRDNKAWSQPHADRRNALGSWLRINREGIFNPFGMSHLAENSHLHAGSFLGVNDTLSAPPASIHQNTEWLAIETGIKGLKRKADHDPTFGDLRIKSTGYVFDSGPNKGWLKAARYKVYINERKVFDHVTDGSRGNIDKNESRGLQQHVAALHKLSPMVSLHGKVPNSVFGTPPTEYQAIQGQRSANSETHPQFTDLEYDDQRHVGKKARTMADALYE